MRRYGRICRRTPLVWSLGLTLMVGCPGAVDSPAPAPAPGQGGSSGNPPDAGAGGGDQGGRDAATGGRAGAEGGAGRGGGGRDGAGGAPRPAADAGLLADASGAMGGGGAGTVASVGTPFDADRRDQSGPASNGAVFGKTPELVPFANGDGSLDVAWHDQRSKTIVITRIVGGEARGHLKIDSLGLLGGYTRDDAGNHYVLTAVEEDLLRKPEPAATRRDGILRLIKLDASGRPLFRTDLKGANGPPIYSPLGFGTGRLAYGSGKVMMAFSQYTEIDPSIDSRHQFHVYLRADAASGQEEASYRGPGHCFDLRLLHDGTSFIGLMLGDAALRGIGIRRVDTPRSSEKVVFAVKGGDSSTFYQNTYTRLGGVAPVSGGFGVLFATEDNAASGALVNAPRNLVYVRVKPEFAAIARRDYDVQVTDESIGTSMEVTVRDFWGRTYAGRNKGLRWLTSYADKATEHAERPRLVAVGDDALVVIWEKWTERAYVSTFAMVIDGAGRTLVAARDIGRVRLNRGDDAVAADGAAVWVNGDETRRALVVNRLSRDLDLTRTVVP